MLDREREVHSHMGSCVATLRHTSYLSLLTSQANGITLFPQIQAADVQIFAQARSCEL